MFVLIYSIGTLSHWVSSHLSLTTECARVCVCVRAWVCLCVHLLNGPIFAQSSSLRPFFLAEFFLHHLNAFHSFKVCKVCNCTFFCSRISCEGFFSMCISPINVTRTYTLHFQFTTLQMVRDFWLRKWSYRLDVAFSMIISGWACPGVVWPIGISSMNQWFGCATNS